MSKRCATLDCEQLAELEIIPGSAFIDSAHTKQGELVFMRGAASYRPKKFCYLCGKRDAGLFGVSIARNLLAMG